MKLPRNAKVFRGQLDVAPFAGVTFLLLIFLVLNSKLVFTPGIRIGIDLPEVSADLPGTAAPTVVVAVDRGGQLYYDSQPITLANLRGRLKQVIQQSREPVTLEVQADKSATCETMAALLNLAREIGMREALFVTRARTGPILRSSRK